ncbi:MAG: phosphotransferase family protein, partial [Phenylobacterium sp.]|nr:phosphotransferase family protein [Phenylobacterium sp.]
MPGARDVEVRDLSRISGGASRQTFRFRLTWTEAGAPRERRMILRRDPPASLIDTERRVEFEAYRAFFGSRVPVPEMIWLEEGTEALDLPFSVAEEITGFEAAPALLWTEPYLASHESLARNKWTILGEIARADPFALGLDRVMPPPDPVGCWARELDMWEQVLDEDQAEPLPITRAAIRWLRAHPPAPAQKIGVVHGDFRTGNFLYDRQGGIHGVLDWEMAHLGDPLEDLGWSLNPVWNFKRNLAGG